jgi:predicted transcriptional regulator
MPDARALSPLEHRVMRVIWSRGPSTAEEIGAKLGRRLKNATVRTLLRRMEEKGFVAHRVEGRAFVYFQKIAPAQAATGAVRRIIQRFCGGSVERLLVGLVEDEVIAPEDLQALARRVRAAQDRPEKARRG